LLSPGVHDAVVRRSARFPSSLLDRAGAWRKADDAVQTEAEPSAGDAANGVDQPSEAPQALDVGERHRTARDTAML
jgi:hypothetical protein